MSADPDDDDLIQIDDLLEVVTLSNRRDKTDIVLQINSVCGAHFFRVNVDSLRSIGQHLTGIAIQVQEAIRSGGKVANVHEVGTA